MSHLMANEGGAGTYLDWGVVHVSVANAVIILLMVVVFVAALLLPFPAAREEPKPPRRSAADSEVDR